MEKKNRKKCTYLIVFFLMFLLAACLTMNVFFCNHHSLYELWNNTAVIETWTISEHTVAQEDGDNTTCFRSLFYSHNNVCNETVTKNIRSLPIITAIPKGFRLLLFPIIVYLFVSFILYPLLPDRWTLVHQKIRLDI